MISTGVPSLSFLKSWMKHNVKSLYRLLAEPHPALFSLVVIAFLTFAASRHWMGGTDWKTLVGLFGLWPLARLAILCTGERNARFPGVAAFAFGVGLTFIAQLSIIVFSTKV